MLKAFVALKSPWNRRGLDNSDEGRWSCWRLCLDRKHVPVTRSRSGDAAAYKGPGVFAARNCHDSSLGSYSIPGYQQRSRI